jgi:hypothetical protein
MSKISSFGVFALFALVGVSACPLWAQNDTPPAATPPPAQRDPKIDARNKGGGGVVPVEAMPAPTPTMAPDVPAPPARDPKFIENGGFSFEPMYWLNKKMPSLYGGAQATGYGDFAYLGDSKSSLAGEIGVPAGRSNTLWFSYFRAQGNTNSTIGQTSTIFSEGYNPGDYVTANYLLQVAKISWDYLSYTWHKPSTDIHLRTLYEVQYVNIGTNFIAPFKAISTNTSTGSTDYNTANGSKNLIYPTLGMAIGSALGKHFRWELKGSGFGIPKHADIWDTEGDLALRLGSVELIVGEKAYHFKTSPGADMFFTDTMFGEFGGIRYYWGAERK